MNKCPKTVVLMKIKITHFLRDFRFCADKSHIQNLISVTRILLQYSIRLMMDNKTPVRTDLV